MFSWFVGWLVRVPARRCREYTQPQEFSTVDWEGHHISPGSGVADWRIVPRYARNG